MEEITPKNKQAELKKTCINCGAELLYKPGTSTLTCSYCNYTQEITPLENSIQELELRTYLNQMGALAHSEEISMVQCKSCGTNQHIDDTYKSLECVYCNSPLILEDVQKEQWILPGAVLPFQISQKEAFLIFKKWVNSLWFAPNNLKKAALDPKITKGLYIPFWTFDANLTASYSGERGEYYYVSVPYTTSINGKTVTRTRQERRTRWYPASGTVEGFIDDTLIKASKKQNVKIPAKIARWDLKKLKPFDSSFLAGFITEKYTISLKDGHFQAEKVAHTTATQMAARDIGGDTQRVHDISVKLSNETFKHILLPVYISNYRYNQKLYSFFINGENGKISGERPYSFWKIFLFICAILVFIGIIAYFL
jgi:DNA-directed RNA polymerase subunit RPC12/RpoP